MALTGAYRQRTHYAKKLDSFAMEEERQAHISLLREQSRNSTRKQRAQKREILYWRDIMIRDWQNPQKWLVRHQFQFFNGKKNYQQ